MILLYILVVAFLTISRPASAQDSGEVLTRDDGKASFPVPLVFHNLTMDEYTAKLSEHRGTSLKKRVPIGFESSNNADQQALVESWSAECVAKWGEGYRIRHGVCRSYGGLGFYCDKIADPDHARWKSSSLPCVGTKRRPKRCETKYVTNHRGNRARLPYCASVIPINEKEKEVDLVPQYDGYQSLPSEVWSPGTIDAFYEMAGDFNGLTGSFDYRGHYSSGESFRSLSPKQVHSWACLGCPSGTLYVSTVGFKGEAVGFAVPAGSWQ